MLRVERVVSEDDPHLAAEQRVRGGLGDVLPVDVLADVEARLRDGRGSRHWGVDADHDLGVGHAGGVVATRLVRSDGAPVPWSPRPRPWCRCRVRVEPDVAVGAVDSPASVASVVGGCVASAAAVPLGAAEGLSRSWRPTWSDPATPDFCPHAATTASDNNSGTRRRPTLFVRGCECVMLRPSARCCRRGSGSRPATRSATVADHRAVRRNRRSRRRAAARAG